MYARCGESIVEINQLDDPQLSFPALDEIRFADGDTFDGTVQQTGYRTDSNIKSVPTNKSLLSPGLPLALT